MASLSDLPIEKLKDDRLGFEVLATQIANVIADKGSSEGLVVGVEGRWGSGKSSLVNLVVDCLSQPTASQPLIVRFQPWLVGERDLLLHTLLRELRSSLHKYSDQSEQPIISRQMSEKLNEKIRLYSDKVAKVGRALSIINTMTGGAVPFMAQVSEGMIAVGEGAGALEDEKPLADLKEELAVLLRKLDRRILVIVDDIDRLEPRDAIEILRLVKAVADFPNMVYLLCYDEVHLAAAAVSATSTHNGNEFLEKFIQVVFTVPLPESFNLRRWFAEEIEKVVTLSPHDADRLATVIDVEGGHRLPTPRSVKRALNAVWTTWPSVRDQVNVADFVWIQLVKTSNMPFYKWIEDYVRNFTSIYLDHATISTGSSELYEEKLREVLKIDALKIEQIGFLLSEMLPGVEPTFRDKEGVGFKLFKTVQGEELQRIANDRRLASPVHSRLYFSLALPADVPTDEEVEHLHSLIIHSPCEAKRLLLEGLKIRQANRPAKSEAYLDRLRGRSGCSASYYENILNIFADIMDDAALEIGAGQFGIFWIWRSADAILDDAVAAIPSDRLLPLLSDIFVSGKSVGWLSSALLNQFNEKDRIVASDRSLSAESRQVLLRLLEARFDRHSILDLGGVPRFRSLIYLWWEHGTRTSAEAWLSKQLSTDEGFLLFFENMTSWQATNGKVRYVLRREDISRYMDYDLFVDRCESIKDSATGNVQLRARVAAIMEMIVKF